MVRDRRLQPQERPGDEARRRTAPTIVVSAEGQKITAIGWGRGAWRRRKGETP